jgi:hypothetical protein
MDASSVVLWLFVVNLGVVAGAGLYEARVVVPLWAADPPRSLASPDSGRRFWGFVGTVPPRTHRVTSPGGSRCGRG